MTWPGLIALGMFLGACLLAYRWKLNAQPKMEVLADLEDRIDALGFDAAHQPAAVELPCTREEFAKVVKQLNTLTTDMETISTTADSLRSAMGVQQMGRPRT